MSICRIANIAIPDQERATFEDNFEHRRGFVDIVPGFEGMMLLRPTAPGQPYQLLTWWASTEAYDAWRQKYSRREKYHAEYNVADYEVVQHIKPMV